MPVIPYREFSPEIDATVFVAPNAWVTGKVKIGAESSLFFGASLRGDVQRILIGERTNVQDNAVLHSSRGLNDCVVGSNVTIGHGAILHGCIVRDLCIIGMGSIVLDDAEISSEVILGANSLVTMRSKIPPGVLALGSPAKPVRDLKPAELRELRESAESYLQVSRNYLEYFSKQSS